MRKDTKNEIIDTGIRLFLEKGYDNVSISSICNECGVTKGSFYYHFPSKDSLLLAYFTHIQMNYAELISNLEKCSSWREKIWLLKSVYLERFMKLNKEILRNLIRIDMEQDAQIFSPEINEDGNEITDFRSLVLDYTVNAQEAGEIDSDVSPEELSRCFSSSFLGAASYWCSSDDCTDLDETVRLYFDLIYR